MRDIRSLVIRSGYAAILITCAMALPWASASAAEPLQLKGTMFMSVVNGNTLSGKLRNGTAFKAYFLSGGIATYADEKGNLDSGFWHIRKDGAVCVKWKEMNKGKERCTIVHLKGRALTLENNPHVGKVDLLGTVVDGFGDAP